MRQFAVPSRPSVLILNSRHPCYSACQALTIHPQLTARPRAIESRWRRSSSAGPPGADPDACPLCRLDPVDLMHRGYGGAAVWADALAFLFLWSVAAKVIAETGS